jgi:dTDP-4-amino-4,6-dideoxygalactose transaminase
MINVTKTYLPPKEEYEKFLQRIWDSSWVTNNGPIVRELEETLKDYFGVKHLFFTSNGTVVLQIALKALGINGEVITTPFSYVATTTAILWENCVPVFADIDQQSLCIDPNKIEPLITENTQAILATHVYGIPCNIEAIETIASKYKLKVIYDAAHTFGTQYKNAHLMSYGDVSTISFHATKLFHTIEGGAIVTNDDEIAKKIKLFRSFGHVNDDYFDIGINAKNSEFHAAIGLCLFPHVSSFIERRKHLCNLYDSILINIGLIRPMIQNETIYNYSYYPVIFDKEDQLMRVKEALAKNDVNTRRYFYPSLNQLPYLKGNSCPVSELISSKVLCLPLYVDLEEKDVKYICEIIKQNI